MTGEQPRSGQASGWAVEEDPPRGFVWRAFGPAGVQEGRAPTREQAEAEARGAEEILASMRGPAMRQGADFDIFYAQTPPWEIGRPQPALEAVAGSFRGRVLDVGCGTGEHALLAASTGLEAAGIDAAPTAIRMAREKAEARGLDVPFIEGDARELASHFPEPFDTVIDSGLFHVFPESSIAQYVDALAEVIAPGGRLYLLSFSDEAPGEGGPRRVKEEDIRTAFADGWRIDSLERTIIQSTGMEIPAWRAVIVRHAEDGSG